jgi:ribosome-binding ATPase YchF (GTP1/OBG family)
VEPVRDIVVNTRELILADRARASARLEKLSRDVRAGLKEAVAEEAALRKAEQALSAGKLLVSAGLSADELKLLKHLNFLTLKPILYCFNGKAGGHNLDELNDGRADAAKQYIESLGSRSVQVDANTERELNDVSDEDKTAFRQELGVHADGLADLIRGAYETLGLISFYTTGPKETRAWTVPLGASAPEAGAAIHSDFRDKFIRAEVVAADDLLAAGSYAAAREQAKVRTEGKEYAVKDGDVMVFLHG